MVPQEAISNLQRLLHKPRNFFLNLFIVEPWEHQSALESRLKIIEPPYQSTIPAFPGQILSSRISHSSDPVQPPKLTVSREDNWFGVQRLPKHDWCMRVVLFHGGICSCKERPD